MPQQQPNCESSLAYKIELCLQQLAAALNDVALHQQLRRAALQYKAAGGRSGGLLQRVMVPSSDPVRRFLHVERVWSLDAGNLALVPDLLAALTAVERSNPERDYLPVRRWLYNILRVGTAGA